MQYNPTTDYYINLDRILLHDRELGRPRTYLLNSYSSTMELAMAAMATAIVGTASCWGAALMVLALSPLSLLATANDGHGVLSSA